MSDDLTLKVLIEIRNELVEIRGEATKTNQRVDQLRDDTNRRFEELRGDTNRQFGELRNELLASETRQATRMIELIGATRNLSSMFEGRFELRDRLERCEKDIAELKKAR